VQHNFGRMDGFLRRPTAPESNPGVTLAAANAFPIGYYTNFHHERQIPTCPSSARWRTGTWSKEAVQIAGSGFPTGSGMAGFGRAHRGESGDRNLPRPPRANPA